MIPSSGKNHPKSQTLPITRLTWPSQDGITAPEYSIKQEFSQEIYESHEKNVWLFELMQTIYSGQR